MGIKFRSLLYICYNRSMFQKIINFIKYNNAFTIGLMIFFFGTTMSFAASPTLRGSVYSSSATVTSVDNRLIVSTNLDNFNFNLRIKSVTEDGTNYYIVYTYKTLAVSSSIWQNVSLEKTLTVSKESLGEKDLGLYVARELADNINYELSYLKKVQEIEAGKGVSKKVVTKKYAGLVGKLLDPEDRVIEGYAPIIPEPELEPEVVPEPPEAPDPNLFVENDPNYVKPDLNPKPPTPKPTPQLPPPTIPPEAPPAPVDEEEIAEIVNEMLPEPESEPEEEIVPPVVEPTPEPQPEADQPPAETPEPSPEPSPEPTPEPTPEHT